MREGSIATKDGTVVGGGAGEVREMLERKMGDEEGGGELRWAWTATWLVRLILHRFIQVIGLANLTAAGRPPMHSPKSSYRPQHRS